MFTWIKKPFANLLLVLCSAAFFCKPVFSLAAVPVKPPNVIIIFMDDMGYGDPDFNAGIGYTTPNMDLLAAEGMRFTDFYAAQPTCTASRAGLLTGCYPNRIGMYGAFAPWTRVALNPKEETIAEALKGVGYHTCMVGKWGLGSKAPYLPVHYGFDEYLGLPYSNDMWPVGYDGRPVTDTANKLSRYPPLPLLHSDSVYKYIRTLDDQGQLTQEYTKYACSYIRKNAHHPFFLYLAHAMVHVPIACSPAFRGKSKNGLFGDVMEEVDWSIGQVMKTLKEEGIDKNTILILTSDNGPWLRFGNHAGSTGGFREGKGTTFEGGQREPCVMRWPGHIPAGTVCNKIASAIDIFPTIAKICGAALPPRKIDGVNIEPLLLGKSGAEPRTDFVYYYHQNDLEAIRQGKWKLEFPHTTQTYKKFPPGHDGYPSPFAEMKVGEALFDLSVDPGETMDVAEQHPDVVKELEALADRYRQDLGDHLTHVKGTGRRPPAVIRDNDSLKGGGAVRMAEQPDNAAVEGLARRIMPGWSGRLVFEKIRADKDVFELESRQGKLIVRGNNDNSMATGLNYYLKYYCHTFVSWYVADPVELPAQMPVVPEKIRRDASVPNRFFLNYCTYGYSMPWWTWKDWERFIDWMALNGINMPLAITGQEAVWYKVWRKFGLSDEQIRSYFTGPAYLPWHRMANIDRWDGPLPQSWLDGQLDLQKKILARERSLGMRPVLPAFAGHVPADLKTRYPSAKITSLGKWGGFPAQYRSNFLDPLDPLFKKIQQSFLQEQTRLFGTDHIYGADPFNEVTPPSWDPSYLATVSRVIYQSMTSVDTSAAWLQMGWIFYYNRKNWTNERIDSFLSAVPQNKMILLDYYDEKTEIWKLTDRFFNQPYIWCYLGNFGGNTMLAGNLAVVESRMQDVFSNGGRNLWGVGSTLEGLDVNPVMYDYVLERAWNKSVDADEWIRDWAMTRCGRADDNVEKAWEILLKKVYISPAVHRSPLTNARPAFKGDGKWTNPAIDYDNADLVKAWDLLLKSTVKTRATYRYDLVNVGRQALGNYFSELRDRFTADYDGRNLQALAADSSRMMGVIDDMDRLVGTQSSFLLGKWLDDAEALGKDKQEKLYYEKDARNILTTWGGPRQSLNDYANRCWSGLLKDFYGVRWNMFIHDAMTAVRANTPFDEKAFHAAVTAFEWDWVQKDGQYSGKPSGDAVTISEQLYDKYAAEMAK